MDSRAIQVAAAVIVREGRVLIARRKQEDQLGGHWEFPGGKIEAEETPELCLVREIREERSLEIEVGTRIAVSRHEFPHRAIVLHAFLVERFRGELQLVDHDAFAWVTLAEIATYRLAPADLPVVRELARRGILL